MSKRIDSDGLSAALTLAGVLAGLYLLAGIANPYLFGLAPRPDAESAAPAAKPKAKSKRNNKAKPADPAHRDGGATPTGE